jgi:hypothetical protein
MKNPEAGRAGAMTDFVTPPHGERRDAEFTGTAREGRWRSPSARGSR